MSKFTLRLHFIQLTSKHYISCGHSSLLLHTKSLNFDPSLTIFSTVSPCWLVTYAEFSQNRKLNCVRMIIASPSPLVSKWLNVPCRMEKFCHIFHNRSPQPVRRLLPFPYSILSSNMITFFFQSPDVNMTAVDRSERGIWFFHWNQQYQYNPVRILYYKYLKFYF